MTRVQNIDQLVLVLRQRLLQQTAGTKRSQTTQRRSPRSPQAIEALAASEGLDDRPLRRAVIQDILAEQFGRELLNQPQFQLVVDRVAATLEDDPNGAQLLNSVIRELREAAGRAG
ncbi:MAG TPA: hypothetical protein VIO94_13425 [Phenylobacterium sp.]